MTTQRDQPGSVVPLRRKPELPPFAAFRGTLASQLPAPSGYRAAHPAVLGPPPDDATAQRFWRKRLIIGLVVAAGLHIVLVAGWWLSPPLRLKAGYAPERWVPVLSIPKAAAAVPMATPLPATSTAAPATPAAARVAKPLATPLATAAAKSSARHGGRAPAPPPAATAQTSDQAVPITAISPKSH